MTATTTSRSKLYSQNKARRQKQGRRKSNLMKKACEYSKMCDADVCLGIRLRETGQVFLLSDSSGFWGFLGTQLGSYYPTPNLVTEKDLERAGKSDIAQSEDDVTLEGEITANNQQMDG
ncbi:uncharacterized protein N7506_005774 [Penicillium brevicompactum]|uniref:uncharacterized protein n=1 Tax=Penicillium brevicompactum TaxID=5074 RepID=UPI0025418C56|nr:uncharacterized protein N7506_005774 [Penicillium brevicompactum]KAJ5335838.1 hypothetical protein N7506_005774 [Penicillium brevicompactum]